jgi:4-hydroxy-2-oxoheptanedioate aldolase
MSPRALLPGQGQPTFGAWLTLPGPFHARTVAQSSPLLSWIVIDCEHGLIGLMPGAAEIIVAINTGREGGLGVSAIVRIPATGEEGGGGGIGWQIKYALDAGARGILVPMVRLRHPLIYHTV